MDRLIAYVIAGAMIGLLTYGLNRGGRGKVDQGAVAYKPRPGIVVIAIVLAALALLVWGASLFAILARNWQDAMIEFLIGLPFLWLAFFTMLQKLILNDEGIRYERWYLQPITLLWSDLSHYEIAASAIVSVLVLRPRSGGPSMVLSSYTFDVKDVLRRVTQKTPIRQQALRRQKWYRY